MSIYDVSSTPKMAATKFLAPLLFVFSGLLLAHHLSKFNQFIPEHLEVLPLDPFNFTFASKQLIQVRMARARGLKSDVYERDSHRNKTILSKIFFSLLFLCGDIQLNPGPYKYPCGICAKPVKSNQRGIQCDSCNIWYHIRCMSMNISTYDALANSSCVWECTGCGLLNFSNSLLDSSTDTICSNRFSLPHGSFISEDKCPSDVSSLSPPALTSSPKLKPKLPKLQKKRHLKGMIINCNGLKGTPRFTQLQALLDLHKPDILLGTESKLDKEIPTYSVVAYHSYLAHL